MIKYFLPPWFSIMTYAFVLGMLELFNTLIHEGVSDTNILEGIAMTLGMMCFFNMGYPVVLAIHSFACACIQDVKNPKSIYIGGLVTGLVVNSLITGNEIIEMLIAGSIAGFVAGWFYVMFRDTTVQEVQSHSQAS